MMLLQFRHFSSVAAVGCVSFLQISEQV